MRARPTRSRGGGSRPTEANTWPYRPSPSSTAFRPIRRGPCGRRRTTARSARTWLAPGRAGSPCLASSSTSI
eukprot:13438410-Alexandrium_andersonii.AAC.1